MKITNVLKAALLLGGPWVAVLNAQTLIDLRLQSKNVDFSQSQAVIPFPTGTVLPPTCNPGEMFFKSDAPSGTNLYGCSATNVWTQEGGAPASLEPEPPAILSITDFTADHNTSTNTLTITCPAGQCNVQTGDIVTAYNGLTSVYRPASGTYTVFIYLDNRVLKYGYPVGTMVSCTSGCTTGVTDFPSNAVQLYTISVSGGVFQAGSLVDRRSIFRAPKKVVQGPNIILAETADTITVSGVGVLRNQPTGIKSACSAFTRGMFWHTNGTTGVKDSVEVCAKESTEVYAWRPLY